MGIETENKIAELENALVSRQLAEVLAQVVLGANPNHRPNGHIATALTQAIGHPYVIEALCKLGADPNDRVSLPLLLAASRYDVLSMEALLKCNANPNIVDSAGNTALHRLIHEPHLRPIPLDTGQIDPEFVKKMFALLIDNGADINVKNHDGESPLERAFRCNDRLAQTILSRETHRNAHIPVI